MRDLVYVVVIVAFFGLMLAYVSFCNRLGGGGAGEEERP